MEYKWQKQNLYLDSLQNLAKKFLCSAHLDKSHNSGIKIDCGKQKIIYERQTKV